MRQKGRKKHLVVGLGASGRAVCELLLSQGARVCATDLRAMSEFNGALDSIEKAGAVLRLGGHSLEDFLGAETIIVSPGIALDIAPLAEARSQGIEIAGELEWASRQVSLPTVAVTGTNGKTTTTALIGEIVKQAGRRPFVGGNIGTPLSRWILSKEPADILVLELSSFQLDTASTFRPDVGVLLNITEDHLDRYQSFEAYADSKLSIFRRQNSADFALINGDDPVCRRRAGEIPGRRLSFAGSCGSAHASICGGAVRLSVPGKDTVEISLEKTRLQGAHNRENIMAACLAALCLDIGAAAMQAGVDAFPGFSHRVEWVRNWKGIDFYDDSKATNVGAVVKALEGFERPVLLLLGGRDKLGAYEPLLAPLAARGKGVFAFGEAGPKIYELLRGKVPAGLYPDLAAAFCQALRSAAPGDVVLLSPACASFDQYPSYARRGDHFKELIAGLNDF
ncbi:MAG: UDP-N-acetylmuramoyl-L-alanine--D-glutamate ligase [Syntrophobacteraceae bacterium]|nr:UDP-N-acetylmuramoyl-L-alanine--D-glutamate ligase [Syntrophobacteraceae bacterium]